MNDFFWILATIDDETLAWAGDPQPSGAAENQSVPPLLPLLRLSIDAINDRF